MSKRKYTSYYIKRMTAIAMFCALAYVCMYFIRIPVQFLTLDIKDAVIILCSLLFGPFAGLFIAVVVPLLEFFTISETGVYGLIMNMCSSVTFSLTASLIYRYKKSLLGAVVGLISGVFAVTAVMLLANLLVTPHFMGAPLETVVAMIPKILLPFNLLKATLSASLVLLLYKPLSTVLKKIGFLQGAPKGELDPADVKKNRIRSLVIAAVAVLVIAASLAVILLVLRK